MLAFTTQILTLLKLVIFRIGKHGINAGFEEQDKGNRTMVIVGGMRWFPYLCA